MHKNHLVVLKALNYISKPNFIIVSTGKCYDHRDPKHFQNIKKYIKQHNLEKYFVILGIVPFKDLCSLMYHSISVLNPSKSEGWGNSASQAALLEKKAIISNIPVHREQLNRNFIYFIQKITNN